MGKARLQRWFESNVWSFERSTSSNMSINGKFWDNAVFDGGDAGLDSIGLTQAQKINTVYNCLNIRSQTIAALPINIFKESPGKKESLGEKHPAYFPIAHEPSNYMSSANMFLSSMINADTDGNSYIYIHRDGRTRPKGFELWDAMMCTPVLVEGEAFYQYEGQTYPARDVLHFRWFSRNGLLGLSPIRMNQTTMGMSKKQDKYASIAIGKRPPSILSYEGSITPEQMAQNKKNWQSDLDAGRTPILSGNWKHTAVMIPPGDAEWLGSKKMTKTEILGMYRMPPIFVQDYERATFTNAEQSDLIFSKHTISPLVRVMEQEINMKILTEAEKKDTYVKFNMEGLLRGDLKSRAEFYTVMRNVGGMDGNEIRSKEDMDNYPGGDIKTIQAANIPVDQLRKFYENKTVASAQPMNPREGEMIDAYQEI